MENRTFYNEILIDHNMHPAHKHPLPDAGLELEGLNPSCGDDIVLRLKIEDGRITEGAFEGNGCAISQASADMMLDLVIGKTKEEAARLSDIFLRMIQGRTSQTSHPSNEAHPSDTTHPSHATYPSREELDELEEAVCLQDVGHMPARVKCAVLGWHTLEELLAREN